MTTQKRKKRPAAKDESTKKYEPTKRELAAMSKLQRAERPPRVSVSKRGDLPIVTPDHPNMAIGLARLMEALGTTDINFLNTLLNQLANAGSPGREVDEQQVNFMLSVINSIEPRDQVEAMLAAQMAAVHVATMTFARRLAHVENIPQQDSAERAFTKLTRTFATQMETLKRYRTGGEQKVTVQHVSVSEGGQAIVGNVTQGPREAPPDKAAASPPLIADARTAPMPRIDKNKKKAPVPASRTLKK
jgi:hypothetical protein